MGKGETNRGGKERIRHPPDELQEALSRLVSWSAVGGLSPFPIGYLFAGLMREVSYT